jgi:small conductance mechanosensitive channel
MLGVLGLDKVLTSILAGIGVIGLVFCFQDIAAEGRTKTHKDT